MSHSVIASEAKQSSLAAQRKTGLLRRGACHRARICATRWLLAMTAKERDQSLGSPPTVLLPRTLHERTCIGRRRRTRAPRPACANERLTRKLIPSPDGTECRILHCSKIEKLAPAKGAMAIRPASLYWCGWHTRFGTGLIWGPAKTAPEETCVN